MESEAKCTHITVKYNPNLRIANRYQQQQNQRKRRNNTSGFKGIYFDSRRDSYVARISINGKRLSLGSRKTAKAAYDELYIPAANGLHGEFARVA